MLDVRRLSIARVSLAPDSLADSRGASALLDLCLPTHRQIIRPIPIPVIDVRSVASPSSTWRDTRELSAGTALCERQMQPAVESNSPTSPCLAGSLRSTRVRTNLTWGQRASSMASSARLRKVALVASCSSFFQMTSRAIRTAEYRRRTSACSGARAAGLRLLPLTPSRAPADA